MADGPTATFGTTGRRRPTTTPLGGPRPLVSPALVAVVASLLLFWAGVLILLEALLH